MNISVLFDLSCTEQLPFLCNHADKTVMAINIATLKTQLKYLEMQESLSYTKVGGKV